MDGSGAQSVILSNPKGRISLFAALLFKQSSGVAEAIYERSVPRSDITTGIKGLKQQGYSAEMDRRNLDVLVQHHIARGLASGNLPPIALVEIAEAVGASEWRDQAIDVQSETDRLFQSLDAEAKADSGIAASLQRVCLSLVKSPMLHSWFEDDADVLALVQGKPRPTKDVAVRRLVEELLPTRMDAWAERLLLLALWLRASNGANDRIWVDFVVLAHELLAGRPMADLPPMVMIAETSFTVASCW
jgi:hypothetical protein